MRHLERELNALVGGHVVDVVEIVNQSDGSLVAGFDFGRSRRLLVPGRPLDRPADAPADGLARIDP